MLAGTGSGSNAFNPSPRNEKSKIHGRIIVCSHLIYGLWDNEQHR